MSYDNRFTIKNGDFRSVYQLDYYEKKNIDPVLGIAFTKV